MSDLRPGDILKRDGKFYLVTAKEQFTSWETIDGVEIMYQGDKFQLKEITKEDLENAKAKGGGRIVFSGVRDAIKKGEAEWMKKREAEWVYAEAKEQRREVAIEMDPRKREEWQLTNLPPELEEICTCNNLNHTILNYYCPANGNVEGEEE